VTLYKTMDGTTGAYGHGTWSLPVKNDDGTWTPGEWMPPVTPVLCESGYHVCRGLGEVLAHAAPELYEVEVSGEHVDGDDKAAWESARLVRRIETWNETTLRLFAVDCARRVAHLAEDEELTHAILDISVAYAVYGTEWDVALERAAAWAAAWGAARATAWAAARDAAWAAARDAAWAAARDAQAGILARYIAGEQGPFVERGA